MRAPARGDLGRRDHRIDPREKGAETHRADPLQQKGHTGGVNLAYRMGHMCGFVFLILELLVKLLPKTPDFQLLL